MIVNFESVLEILNCKLSNNGHFAAYSVWLFSLHRKTRVVFLFFESIRGRAPNKDAVLSVFQYSELVVG